MDTNSPWAVAVLLGLIEGVTEFLPVSSTGHLLLAESVLPRQSDAFNVIVQTGAVLAVLAAFRGRLTELWRARHTPATRRLVLQLATAFAITAVGGLCLKASGAKLPQTARPVAWATLIGGLAFLLVEGWLGRRDRAAGGIGWPAALAVGAGQLLAAAAPGASRSGTTILCAMLLGASRPAATEFSFLLGVPTLLSAGALEAVSLLKHGAPSEPWGPLVLASLVSLISAFAVVQWLLGFVRRHSFVGFGLYRIALGAWLLWGT